MEPEMKAMEQEWTDKLKNKKIVDQVSDDQKEFCKSDLPQQNCRIIAPGQMVTRDFVPNRLNVHLNGEGICTHVRFQ